MRITAMGNLSEHFSMVEFERSSTASALKINNSVTSLVVNANIIALCANVLEPLRKWWGKPIKIGSGYRCPALNKAVGGVSNSQHMTGEAADLCLEGNNMKMGEAWLKFIKENLDFDQVLLEHNKKGNYWVHVSFSRKHNRKEVIWNLLKK